MNQLISTSSTIDLSSRDALISIGLIIALSLIMYLTFRIVHSKINYDEGFNVMLVMLAFITTLIMLLVRENLAMSLGMVGSLSLVRFRTNIKDTRDIGFVFWAMTIGLAAANQAFFLGFLGSILIAGLLILSSKYISYSDSLLLVIRGRQIDLKQAQATVKKYSNSYNLKAQNLLEDSFELVYEFKSTPDQQEPY